MDEETKRDPQPLPSSMQSLSSSSKSRATLSLLKTMRPSYFLQTKEGAYNGMIKHNLLSSTRTSVGSSLSFTELCSQAAKLRKYSEATGNGALTYFNLINGAEEHVELERDGVQLANGRKLSLFVPYPSKLQVSKNILFHGF